MMRHIFVIFLILFSAQVWAEEVNTENLQLASAPINQSDMASIKRGAKFFSTNCMSCHTLIYLRYDKIAQEAGITYDKMPVNVKSWPYGITPPDLSLEADIRGVDWLYTYLHSFYVDKARPTGVNNLLVHNTAMPGIIMPYQGEQELVANPVPDLFNNIQWYDAVKLVKQGMLKPDDFDATIADVVDFLAYAAEPFHQEQHTIGWWVLGFLAFLFVLMYLLKCEYWKDVKKNNDSN